MDELNELYDSIENIDVIVAHSPPSNFGDLVYHGERVGSKVMDRFIEKFKPKLFVCGHIHEDSGVFKHSNGVTTVVNAALINIRYTLDTEPFYFELDIEND